MMFGKEQPRKLMVKDLMNDLVRETNIKERIRKQLDKPLDRARQFDSRLNQMASSSFISFASSEIGFFPQPLPPQSFTFAEMQRRQMSQMQQGARSQFESQWGNLIGGFKK